MATIEFLQKRITGKEKEITKLEKKLERIQKAAKTNWSVNPYMYNEYDLRTTTKDLDTAHKALTNYKQQLQTETEKANSRNITVILQFLEQWKERVRAYYLQMLPKYLDARATYLQHNHEYCEWFNTQRRNASREEYKQRSDQNRKEGEKFKSEWNWLRPYVEKEDLNFEKLNNDLDIEANNKYDFIIERTNVIVGQIIDAANLKIGENGDLNGIIIGTKGSAKIQTIGAGGYNIQCFHFRTLIKKH